MIRNTPGKLSKLSSRSHTSQFAPLRRPNRWSHGASSGPCPGGSSPRETHQDEFPFYTKSELAYPCGNLMRTPDVAARNVVAMAGSRGAAEARPRASARTRRPSLKARAQTAECDHADKPQAAAGARRGGRAAAPEGLCLLTPAPRKRRASDGGGGDWTVRPRPTPGTGCRALATASDAARGELSSALQLAARRPAARPYASTRSRQLAYAPMRPYSTRSEPAGVQRPPAPRTGAPARRHRRSASSPLVLSVTSHGTSHGPRTTICTRHPT